jgi:DnaD/phage-associated family protein
MQGYIRIYRKIRENPIFNDMELFRLWMICLTEATHKERDQQVGKQVVHLMPGEFVTGRFDLETIYNHGLKRDQQKSPKTIWRWLETLKNNEYLTIKTTNKFSIVAVLNWSLYQYSDHEIDQQVTNKRPTSDQQVTTNNNDLNVLNALNDLNLSSSLDPFRLFESSGFGTPNSIIIENINDLVKTYTEVWVCEAMKVAVLKNKRSLSFVNGVLKNWNADGIDEPWKGGKDNEKPKGLQSNGNVREGEETTERVGWLASKYNTDEPVYMPKVSGQ